MTQIVKPKTPNIAYILYLQQVMHYFPQSNQLQYYNLTKSTLKVSKQEKKGKYKISQKSIRKEKKFQKKPKVKSLMFRRVKLSQKALFQIAKRINTRVTYRLQQKSLGMVEKETFQQIQKKDLSNMTEKDIIGMLNKTFYTTTYQSIGDKCSSNLHLSKFGLNGHFTKHLQHAGMWSNNSLHTTVDKERYMDGSKDWMDKIN